MSIHIGTLQLHEIKGKREERKGKREKRKIFIYYYGATSPGYLVQKQTRRYVFLCIYSTPFFFFFFFFVIAMWLVGSWFANQGLNQDNSSEGVES